MFRRPVPRPACRDFYGLALNRLNANGLVAQWWPLPTQNDEDSRQLVRSFIDLCPYASLWTTELHEMLLIGSAQPIELDEQRLASRFKDPGVTRALGEVGVDSPAALLATWIADRDSLVRYAANVRPVTDDHPSIEYATWVRRGEFARVLPAVLALQTEPPLVGAAAGFADDVAAHHRTLMHFYSAAQAALDGDRISWSRDLAAALRAEPGNPYFRWIAGDSRTGGHRFQIALEQRGERFLGDPLRMFRCERRHAVEREVHLHRDGLLAPQRAVVVEDRDPFRGRARSRGCLYKSKGQGAGPAGRKVPAKSAKTREESRVRCGRRRRDVRRSQPAVSGGRGS